MPAPPTARGTPGLPDLAGSRRLRARRAWSCRGEVRLEAVDVDHVARQGVGPPQLTRGEAHAVAVLGLLAEAGGVGVGIDEDAVVAIDDATLAARITGQPRVARRIDVAGYDAVAGLELRRHVVLHPRGAHGA